jgi:hypothetical protein
MWLLPTRRFPSGPSKTRRLTPSPPHGSEAGVAAVRHMTRRWSDCTNCCCGWPGARSVDAAARWRAGPELDDLAHQAVADALVGVTAKIARVPRREPVHHLGLQVRHLRGVDQERPPLLQEADGAHGRRGLGPAA